MATLLGFSLSSSSLSLPLLSSFVGAIVVLVFFADYFRRKRAEIATIAHPAPEVAKPSTAANSKPSAARKSHHNHHSRSHHHATADKDQNKRHHHLDVNTLKGHGDEVTAIAFSSDGKSLVTACGDGVVRVYRLDDVSSKSFKILRINLPAGAHPTAIAFSEGDSSVVVAAENLLGSSLYMFGNVGAKPSGNDNKQQAKLPPPEMMWDHHKVHDKSSILNLSAASATYGTGDGSTVIISCSEGVEKQLLNIVK